MIQLRLGFGALLALLVLPTGAAAKLAYPPNCTAPHVVILVGRNEAGVADPIGEFTASVRDIANVPIAGALIGLYIADCTDARFATDQSPEAVVDCPAHWVVDVQPADANGVAHMRVVGRADHGAPATTGAMLWLRADGVNFALVRLAMLDQDGGGLGPSDLSLWLDDCFNAPAAARSDYDGDGVVGPADLSIWLDAFFAAGSIQGGSASTCPQ